MENKDESDDPSKIRRLMTDELFEGLTEILIIHNNAEYRLRITRNDKLILTK